MGRFNHTCRHILLVPVGSQSKQKQLSSSTSVKLISYYRVFNYSTLITLGLALGQSKPAILYRQVSQCYQLVDNSVDFEWRRLGLSPYPQWGMNLFLTLKFLYVIRTPHRIPQDLLTSLILFILQHNAPLSIIHTRNLFLFRLVSRSVTCHHGSENVSNSYGGHSVSQWSSLLERQTADLYVTNQ